MKYSTLLDRLQNLIDYTPKQSELCKILGSNASTIGARAQRDSHFNEEELAKIEDYYAIKLIGGGSADTVQIDFYPDVFGSCGSGAFVLSENKESFTVPKSNISNYSPSKNYSIINTIGDSMQPYLHSGDKLIVEHWNGEQIRDNSIYVFRYKDEIFVKRLSKNIDQIIIKSDNPIYDTRKINTSDDFQIIGLIVGLMRDLR